MNDNQPNDANKNNYVKLILEEKEEAEKASKKGKEKDDNVLLAGLSTF